MAGECGLRIMDSQKFCPCFSAGKISLKVLRFFSGLENSVDPGSKALVGDQNLPAEPSIPAGASVFFQIPRRPINIPSGEKIGMEDEKTEKDWVYRNNYEAQIERKIGMMDERDKELVKSFCKQKRAEGVSQKRLLKLVHTLYGWRQFLPDKRWEEITKQDFVDVILKLNQSTYKQNTKVDYKKILKLFYKFVKGTDTPEETSWIKTCERRKEIPNQEIITEDDMKRLLDVIPDIKFRCFFEIIYLGGFRIGEIIPMRCGDISFLENGAVRVTVSGKTGTRNPLIISKYIKEWYALHPERTNKKAFFFFKKNDVTCPMSYTTIRKHLVEYAKKSKIDSSKPYHFHWFRHSSVSTKMLHKGWSPAESAAYHGHSITTSERYFHRNACDADNAVLRSQNSIKEKTCPRCSSKNADTVKRCTSCGSLMDVRYAEEEQEQKKFMIDMLVGMLKDDNKRKELLGMLEKEVNALETS